MNVFTRRCFFGLLLTTFALTGATPDRQADQIVGRWLFPTKGSSMDVFRLGDRYFARVAEVDQAGERNYGLVKETVLIRNLKYDGEVWAGGQMIHPKTGMSLSVEVEMKQPQAMTVTIYKGIKLLRRTFIMTRQSEQ